MDASASYAASQQLQAQLDGLRDGDVLELHAFEYPGPIVMRKGVALDGHGATLWALQGPVCIIESPGVTLKNLRIEATGDDIERGDALYGCALQVVGGHNVLLEDVQVRGSVQGLPAEEGQWRYPLSIDLGSLAYGREHRLVLRLYVPVPCSIKPEVHGISVNPHTLTPGRHEVTLTVDTPARDAVLFGCICLHTAFLKRQISVNGRIVPSAPAVDGRVLYEPPDWDRLGPVQPPREKRREAKPSPPPQPLPKAVVKPTGPREPPEPPSPPVGGSPRDPYKPSVPCNVFTRKAPPPIQTAAGHFEPGMTLPSFLAPTPSAPQTPVAPTAQEPESGPSAADSTPVISKSGGRSKSQEQPVAAREDKQEPKKKTSFATRQSIPVGGSFGGNAQPAKQGRKSEDKGTSKSEEQPVVAPERKEDPKQKTPSSAKQSIPIGNAFGRNAQPDKQEKKKGEDKNSDSTPTEPQAEKPQPRRKPKRPKGNGTVPDMFLQ